MTLLADPHMIAEAGEIIDRWAAPLACDNCFAINIIEFTGDRALMGDATEAGRAVTGRSSFQVWDVDWQPKGAVVRKVEDVPDGIDEAAGEAIAALAIGAYKASVLMCRAVIEATAKDHGITCNGIKPKIDALEEQRIITPVTAESAHEVRLLGNEMAHGDFATTSVSEADARLILEITESILAEVYQRPARLARARQEREANQAREPLGG